MLPALAMSGQQVVDFENLPLAPNSAYSSTASAPFQSQGIYFNHVHAFNTWSEGFTYTNKYDSTNGTYTNLYGVKAYKGYGGSDKYAVGQYRAVMRTGAASATVNGMYITNTTYAYKTIRDGDNFSRKFGDTTGTGSGTTVPQGAYPDYFKLLIRGYQQGVLKPDSVTFYLADYRGTNDYIVDSWQFVNTAALGAVDSLVFTFRSSDMNAFGIKTPAFFAMDNVSVSTPVTGLAAGIPAGEIIAYPTVFTGSVNVNCTHPGFTAVLADASGRIVAELPAGSTRMENLESLESGIYILRVHTASGISTMKLIRQ
jgi:hypothetical protein